MFRILLVTLVSATMAYAQLAACTAKEHCPTGQYCEGHFCRDCLSCVDMHREPPPYHTDCIKSVIECGGCVEGYTQDQTGVSSDCLPSVGPGVSPYVWLGLAIGFAFVVIITVILVFLYLHRNGEGVKITSLTQVRSEFPSSPPATAPPPYEPSPPYAPSQPGVVPFGEEASPLMKGPVPELGVPNPNSRESARLQAARVYNNPAYVRGANLPGSPELSYEDETHVEPFVSHDEDTMESVWTPHNDDDVTEVNQNTTVAVTEPAPSSTALRRASPTELAPPNKMARLHQDTNNNRDPSNSDENPSSTSSGALVTLNFNLNVNTNAVQQLNNVTL